MLQRHSRRLGALFVGLALALPLAAAAQAPATSPKPPETAPTRAAPTPPKPEGGVSGQAAPAQASPAAAPAQPAAGYTAPTPNKSSTAVPGWNNPPESWGALSEKPAYASIPGRETNRLIQGEGREWRAFRNGPLTRYGGWVIAGVFAAIMLFYLVKGAIKLHGAPTGRLIERFNAVERTAHWTAAICFTLLALTGVVILWGKHIVLPWLGYGGFSWLTILSKNVHNFIGPLFIFSIVVLFLLWVKDNLISSVDLKWLSRAGGMVGSGPEMPSGRFNGGEKAWFWFGVVLLGATVSITGLILDFPNWNQGREAMQQANVIHAAAAVLFICLGLGHAYLGTLGLQGAYRAMRDGYVDETWAREHHVLWYEEVKAGKRPERILPAGAQPVGGDD